MKIMNREEVIELLSSKLKKLIIFLYSWISSDSEVLGYILGVAHFITAILIVIVLFVSHTIYPALWLQGVVLFGLILIWLQHLFLKVCISTIAEEEFTKGGSPYFKLVEDLISFFNIKLAAYLNNILLIETIAVACFSLSFIGRISVLIHNYYNIPY